MADRQIVLVPLVVEGQLLTWHDLSRGKETNGVVHIRLDLPSQVERLDVRITAVVDESCLVAVEH